MEVNTRFWGSLQLAIDAGVDFPKLLLQSSLTDAAPASPQNYKIGQRLRWLLGDLDNLYLTFRRSNDLKSKVLAVLHFLTPHPLITRHEINRWSDLKPALFELKNYFRNN
jgi:hypothetical protein